MDIKKFTAADIPACAAGLAEAFNAPPWSENWRYERALEYVTDFFHHPKFFGFILSDGESDAAYALCYERYWYCADDRYEIYLDTFFVRPEFQSKGYGRELMKFLENYSTEHNLRNIMLLTKRDMDCYHFYHGVGFSDVENLVILSKEVN